MNNTSCSESTIHSSFQNKIKSESTESLLLVSQNHFFLSRKVRVFIDQFGIRQYKTILFTLVYMTNPYGQVIGFAIGTVLFPNDWIFSLFCIGCILKIFGLLFLYFQINISLQNICSLDMVKMSTKE